MHGKMAGLKTKNNEFSTTESVP